MDREPRKIVVSPAVNTPEPFVGFGGFCGWPRICRLRNGDLYVVFSAGYGHASWVNPRPDLPPEYAEYMDHLLEGGSGWNAPTGGHISGRAAATTGPPGRGPATWR